MKITNAIKKLKNAEAEILRQTENTIEAGLGDYIISAHINNGSERISGGVHVRNINDVSDPMTDYFAGAFYDNLTQAINAAKRYA